MSDERTYLNDPATCEHCPCWHDGDPIPCHWCGAEQTHPGVNTPIEQRPPIAQEYSRRVNAIMEGGPGMLAALIGDSDGAERPPEDQREPTVLERVLHETSEQFLLQLETLALVNREQFKNDPLMPVLEQLLQGASFSVQALYGIVGTRPSRRSEKAVLGIDVWAKKLQDVAEKLMVAKQAIESRPTAEPQAEPPVVPGA